MFARFGLMALMISLAAGCDEEAKASTGDDASDGTTMAYDDTDVLARLDALEAAVDTMQEGVEANAAAIAAIDTSVLSYRLDEVEEQIDLLGGDLDLTAINDQIAANTEAIAAVTDIVSTVDANTASIEILEETGFATTLWVTAQHYGSADDIENNAATIAANSTQMATNTESIASNAAEIAAITGAVDLYDLVANVADLDIRVSAIDESYVTETILAATVEGINASLATVTTAIDENYASIVGNLENTTTNTAKIEGNIINIDTNKSTIVDMTATVGENYTNILGLQTADDLHDDEIDSLFLSIDDMDTIPGLSSYLTVDESTHTVQFSGANVQLINGGDWDATSEKNGLGNLIIGYNEELMVWGDPLGWVAEDERSGSHNLVVGGHHSFTGSSGIVSGDANRLYASQTAAIGGNNILCTEGACVGWLYADGLTLEAAPTW